MPDDVRPRIRTMSRWRARPCPYALFCAACWHTRRAAFGWRRALVRALTHPGRHG